MAQATEPKAMDTDAAKITAVWSAKLRLRLSTKNANDKRPNAGLVYLVSILGTYK